MKEQYVIRKYFTPDDGELVQSEDDREIILSDIELSLILSGIDIAMKTSTFGGMRITNVVNKINKLRLVNL